MEKWKEIKGYEGLYWISDQGRVKNKHNHILKPEYSNKGYACVQLTNKGIVKKYRIHRLVATYFIPNPDNLPEVNHKDENKMNNCVSNLEWCTRQYNVDYSIRSGRITFKQEPVYCFDLDQEFRSASEAAVHLGLCRTSIVKCCRGQLHQVGGMLWCYLKDKAEKFPLR